MPHNVLAACRLDARTLNSSAIQKRFRELGFFYVHRTETAGFVFRAESLEAFVAQHGQDPALLPGGTTIIPNYAQEFQRILQEEGIHSRLCRPKPGVSEIIRRQYDYYQVLLKSK